MEKVVLKVNVSKYYNGVKFTSAVNGYEFGAVGSDFFHVGRYSGNAGLWGSCNNSDYTDALEFVSDCIERNLGKFGISVEFVTLED